MIVRGATQAEVARRLDVTREAVRQWFDAWTRGGPAAIAARPRVRSRRVDLDAIDRVLRRVGERPGQALTALRVRDIIERAFGVTYCASSARGILHRLGYAYSHRRGWWRPGERRGRDAAPEAKRRAS